MNLTNQAPYQKGTKKPKRSVPTKQQRERWEKIRAIGCLICKAPAEIHHLFTGAGGARNHDKVAPLCHNHHRGGLGLHTLGRKKWQAMFMTEQEMFERVNC